MSRISPHATAQDNIFINIHNVFHFSGKSGDERHVARYGFRYFSGTSVQTYALSSTTEATEANRNISTGCSKNIVKKSTLIFQLFYFTRIPAGYFFGKQAKVRFLVFFAQLFPSSIELAQLNMKKTELDAQSVNLISFESSERINTTTQQGKPQFSPSTNTPAAAQTEQTQEKQGGAPEDFIFEEFARNRHLQTQNSQDELK